VLIRRAGDQSWKSPDIKAYADEEALEALLFSSPQLLPGVGDSSLVMARQVQTGAGPIDLVGVGLDGLIVLVECKLRGNPEIRRAVVGQLFAYASALWSTPYPEFERAIAARLSESLEAAAQALAGSDAWDAEAFRANVGRNLKDGRFRLVIAVDSITDELRRTIEYLNEHTIAEVEVAALEIVYVADGGVEMVVPKTYGLELARSKTQGGEPVGEDELFAALQKACSPAGVEAVRRLYEWVEPHGGNFAWGLGIAYPSTNAWFSIEGHRVCTWSCYARSAAPTWDVDFEYLSNKGVTAERMRAFADELRTIPGVSNRFSGLEESGFKRRPSLAVDSILTQPGAVDTILRALETLVDPPGHD